MVIGHASSEVDRVLGDVLAGVKVAALLDAPTYANVGDNAIWVAQLRWLRARGIRVAYTCDRRTYSARALAARLPADGVILLSGGGSLGDLWPEHQELRERVVADFPARRIVVLPQSLHFESAARRERAQRSFDRHPRLTLLLRDVPSLEQAAATFAATTLLCPDITFTLALSPPRTPASGIVWLGRWDQEARAEAQLVPPTRTDVTVVDWGDEGAAPTRSLRRRVSDSLHYRTRAAAIRFPRLRRPLAQVLAPAYERTASHHLERGCALLGRGSVVVTDRLHGHILALLMGMPHVLLDNRTGKVRACYEQWTRTAPNVRWADNAAEALDHATALLDAPAGGGGTEPPVP